MVLISEEKIQFVFYKYKRLQTVIYNYKRLMYGYRFQPTHLCVVNRNGAFRLIEITKFKNSKNLQPCTH